MEAYNNRGLVFAKQQKFKSALADYSRAIELNPSIECVFYNRAFSYLNQKLFDSAIKDYSKAIELNPGYTSAYVNRGVAFHRAGNHKLAFQDYNKALLLDPEHISAIINRGNLFREQKKFKEALLDYHNGIQLQPDHFMANLNQAYCNFFSGEFENASLGFNRCIGIKSIDFYLYIWKFLSDKRLGFSNQRIFPEDLEALLDDDIPRLVAEILLERKDPSSILKTLADDKEKQCEVFFYVGEYYLLKNNTSKASKFFNDCISTGINYCIEYQAAKVELGRL